MNFRKIMISLVVVCLMLTAFFVFFSGGCTRVVGESDIFTEEEIQSAMDAVIVRFKLGFKGCKLREVRYEEEINLRDGAQWAEQYGADSAIVLLSTFDVGSSGGDGSLNPNSTYSNWQWILTRNDGERWELRTSGY